jgi:hypothetical protein
LTPYSREGFLEPIYELIESGSRPFFEMTYKCYNQLKARDKTSLDVFWLRDKSLHLWISRLKAVASDPARANIAWLDRMEACEVQIVTTFGTACARPRA